MQLHEEYRPAVWGDVVGQDKAIKLVSVLRQRGLAGRAYWISGISGAGKTTIAKLLAAEVANDVCVDELDALDLTPSRLKDIERSMYLIGWGGKGRAYIINEAHGLSKASIRQLLVMLERLPKHVIFVFTTTCEAQDVMFETNIDANPLLSRCQRLQLARRDIARPFAERVQFIAKSAELDGQPIEAYIKLMRKHGNNMRAALQDVEAGAMLV